MCSSLSLEAGVVDRHHCARFSDFCEMFFKGRDRWHAKGRNEMLKTSILSMVCSLLLPLLASLPYVPTRTAAVWL